MITLAALLSLALAAPPTWAAAPEAKFPVTFQTALTPGRSYIFSFSIWTAKTGGTKVANWSEASVNLPVASNRSVYYVLGTKKPLPALDFSQQYWVQLQTGTRRYRVRLPAAGYAFWSESVNLAPLDVRYVEKGQAGGVTTPMIGNGQVTAAKVSSEAAGQGTVLVADGAGGASWQAIASWQLGGNAGTNPATNFIGTTDNQALEIRVNGERVMRFDPNPTAANVIGGWSGNHVEDGVVGAFIGGGGLADTVQCPSNQLLGDCANRVTSSYGTVSGGLSNTAGRWATVGGGLENSAGPNSTVSGGANNRAPGNGASVGGGVGNRAEGTRSAISGGQYNRATGYYASVPGGSDNVAGGGYSLAAGNRAVVRDAASVGGGDTDGDQGTFVWADSTGADFRSTGPDQFLIRAAGGVGINKNTPGTALDVNGQVTVGWHALQQNLNFWDFGYGIGVQAGTYYERTGGSFAWFKGGTHSDDQYSSGGGALLMQLYEAGDSRTETVTGIARAQQFVQTSDRHAKEGFEPVDGREVLAKVVAMPVMRWKYRNEATAIRHLGPVAQDFRAAFGLGADDKSITTVDADGVALAAIQGLNALVTEQRAALGRQEAALEAQESRLQDQGEEIAELRRQFAAQALLIERLVAANGRGGETTAAAR